jgi:hypothetical protein
LLLGDPHSTKFTGPGSFFLEPYVARYFLQVIEHVLQQGSQYAFVASDEDAVRRYAIHSLFLAGMNYPAASGRGINKENIFNIAASGGE